MSPRALLMAGPTASGKTSLATALAKLIDGVVINADSMQVYDRLNILSARPSGEEMDGIPHQLFAIIPPQQAFSTTEANVAVFVESGQSDPMPVELTPQFASKSDDWISALTDSEISDSALANGSATYYSQTSHSREASTEEQLEAKTSMDSDSWAHHKIQVDAASGELVNIATASLLAVTLSRPFNRVNLAPGSEPNTPSGPYRQPRNDWNAPPSKKRRRRKGLGNQPLLDESPVDPPARWSAFAFATSATSTHVQPPAENTSAIDSVFLDRALMSFLELSEAGGLEGDQEHRPESSNASMSSLSRLVLAGALTTVATGVAVKRSNRRHQKVRKLKPAVPHYTGPTVTRER